MVTFDIGSDGSTVKAQLTGAATYKILRTPRLQSLGVVSYRRIVCILQKDKEIVKSVISRGIPVEKFFELGGEIIKLDTSPNSTHVNVFEMAGIDPKKVEENTKLINDLINSMKE